MSEVRIEKVSTNKLVFLLVGAKILDLLTTFIALRYGYGYESNPITTYFLITGGFFTMTSISILVVIGICLLFYYAQIYLDKPRYPAIFLKIIVFSIYLCFIINITVVVSNIIIIFQNML